jgi:hypothetical protein
VVSGITAIVQKSPTKCGKNIGVTCWATRCVLARVVFRRTLWDLILEGGAGNGEGRGKTDAT